MIKQKARVCELQNVELLPVIKILQLVSQSDRSQYQLFKGLVNEMEFSVMLNISFNTTWSPSVQGYNLYYCLKNLNPLQHALFCKIQAKFLLAITDKYLTRQPEKFTEEISCLSMCKRFCPQSTNKCLIKPQKNHIVHKYKHN